MDCRVVQELISTYIDGELDGEKARMLEEHLESCQGCSQKLEHMKALVQMVGTFEEEELPDGFLDRLHARLEAKQVSGVVSDRRRRFSGWIRLAGIAAAAAIFVLAIRVLNPGALPYTSPQGKSGTDSAVQENVSEGLAMDLQDERPAPGDTSAGNDEGQQVLNKGEVSVSGVESEDLKQASETDGYIKSDKVQLKVQDVCITPQTLAVRAIQHGIDVLDQTEDSITLKVNSVEQRKALYRELKLLGTVEEVGTDFQSETVTVVIVDQD